MIALILPLLLQEPPLRVEGPPFLPIGGTAEVRAVSSLAGAVPVWRISDAPGGAGASLETDPPYDAGTLSVRGAQAIRLKSVGKGEGDILLALSMERRGRRLAAAEFRLRVGLPLRVRAWCRVVEHARGGTERPGLVLQESRRLELEASVNRVLRGAGVEVALEPGQPVKAPDEWFDGEGRFHPVALKDGKKVHSLTLQELLKRDQPGGINIYLVRDCHWTVVEGGFRKTVTEHSLMGIGMKGGQVVLDDSADELSLVHELGHAFSLDDLHGERERGRMMFSIRRLRTGLAFTYGEMLDARERARLHLRAHSGKK
jgi:hypothetical protein